MRRILSALLVVTLIFFNILILAACSTDTPDGGEGSGNEGGLGTPDGGDEGEGNDNGNGNSGDSIYDANGIIKPTNKEYDRSSKTFELYALDYVRPDVDKICADFEAVCQLIFANELPYEDQLNAIYSLEEGFIAFKSMSVLAEIFNSKDLTNEYWLGEYQYTTSNAPRFSQAVESLFVACAKSPHVEAFENDYFGEDIEEEYKDGGRLSESVVEIMEEESRLEAEYKGITPSTVMITAFGKEMSFEEAIEELKGRYTEGSLMYTSYYTTFYNSYMSKADDMMADIYVELVKVRYLLAEELGYDSYIEYTYDMRGYEYTSRDLENLFSEIKEYAYPVYSRLYNLLFYYYFNETQSPKTSYASAMNTAYTTTKALDEEFSDIYNFMLLYGVYDVGASGGNRFDTSFTTYLYGNDSPYLFVSADGYATDYLTITHEFGHFIDYYVNGSASTSLELAEVCSQGFELLSLSKLKSNASSSVYKYLLYVSMSDFFEVLINQSFYAAFEHEVYSIDYESINLESIQNAIEAAEVTIFGNAERDIRVGNVMIPHVFIAPLYVQSYVTSIIPAIEIYLREVSSEGTGLEAYKTIIYREEAAGFLDTLTEAGLTSPFERGLLDDLSDKIYFLITGMHYKIESSTENAA